MRFGFWVPFFLGLAFAIASLAAPLLYAAAPDWLGWAGLTTTAILLVVAFVVGMLSRPSTYSSSAGVGGKAKATGVNSDASGGKGGDAGIKASGGKGGDAHATGKNSRARGGDGGRG